MHPIKHFITITRHRHKVRNICFKIGIPLQGLMHDLSKYSFTEFIPGAKYYEGTRSPNVKERELLGYSKAWLHHKGRNKHHFEYWQDIVSTGGYGPIKMPIKYLKEMFADRIAASKIYRGKDYKDEDPLIYLVSREAKCQMHKETYNELYKWLMMLKEKGEKETFRYVKKLKSY